MSRVDSAEIGGPAGAFPTTRWSVIRCAADPASPAYRASLEKLAAVYWRPVYAHFRRKWGKSSDEAKDLTQEFFAALCAKDFLSRLSPDAGRFRSYILAALDNFATLQHRHDTALKRGGGIPRIAIEMNADFDPSDAATPEEAFLRSWARTVLDDSLREMEHACHAAGQAVAYELFVMRDVNPPGDADLSYDGLAKRFGIAVTDVTNFLFRARKELRRIVLNRVRDTVTTDEEAEAEMRELFEDGEA